MPEEKIICCGDPYRGNNDALAYALAGRNNNDALMGALLGQRDNSAGMAAMMNGGMNNWANNPFIYLVWMMFANRMWGNNCENGGCNNAQYAALQNQISDNQNANLVMDGIHGNAGAIRELATNLNCDFNTLNSSICDVKAGIQQVAGQIGFSAERVINAVNMGDCNVIQALQNCCCQTQQAILKMGYEQQLATCQQTYTLSNGQRDLGVAISQGFAATAYETQRQTCDLLNAGERNTQRIIDTLNTHWNQDLQQRYNDARLELSQLRQNATLIAALRTTGSTATPTT